MTKEEYAKEKARDMCSHLTYDFYHRIALKKDDRKCLDLPALNYLLYKAILYGTEYKEND